MSNLMRMRRGILDTRRGRCTPSVPRFVILPVSEELPISGKHTHSTILSSVTTCRLFTQVDTSESGSGFCSRLIPRC